MKLRLFNLLAIGSAILFAAVCVFWVRSRSRSDELMFMHCRYLPDKSITSDEVYLMSIQSGVELSLMHGHVPPRPVDLVRGYDVNADITGGRPTVGFGSEPYDPFQAWISANRPSPILRSPIHLDIVHRQQPKGIDDCRGISLTISHWLLAVLLLVMPTWRLKRFRTVRRARKRGMCAKCDYDLRATPERCPECGTLTTTTQCPES
jgi:hypothetical protein